MKEPGFISIRLQPTELVLLIPEETPVENIDFEVSPDAAIPPALDVRVAQIKFDQALDFFPPEIGRIPLHRYVAQKIEAIPGRKGRLKDWLQAFGLAPHTDMPVADLPLQAHFRLQMLIALSEQHGVIALSNATFIESLSDLLWHIKGFCLKLKNPLVQAAWVLIEEELTPPLVFSMERILEIEAGVVEEIGIDF